VPANTPPSRALLDRYQGSLLGLAVGDAVGTSVEFRSRGSFAPVTDMTGGGPFALKAGQWTDDTSMALCLAESLLNQRGFDARDQMARYLNWWQWGYLSATGECFDIGMTVRTALQKFQQTGEPFAGSADPRTAGNGSLMRLAPAALYYFPNYDDVWIFCGESSRTTHGAPEAIECCKLFGTLLVEALRGDAKALNLNLNLNLNADAPPLREPKVKAIANGSYIQKSRDEIVGSGYAVASLEAALWCFHHTDNFADAVLAAANLGDDADTTAAIVGQLAGAHYGARGIPTHWLEKLHMRDEITATATALHAVYISTVTAVSDETLAQIERHFHAVILGRVKSLIEESGIALPKLTALRTAVTAKRPPAYFPVSGMYGGFSYTLQGQGDAAKLIVESSSRISGGSGQRHEITRAGSRLIAEGFV
jgi:ADP-ribosyl-[dinitrogen reductase] hydrolase